MADIQITPDEAANAARREYQREWRKKNPDKVRATQQRYWTRKAAEIRNQAAETAATDPESCRDNNR